MADPAPSRPVAARLSRIWSIARRSTSTKVTEAAPRESASMPSAPDPAKPSRTVAPSTAPRLPKMSKIASRTRSLVGRRPGTFGAFSRRPRAVPPITRTPRRHRSAPWPPNLRTRGQGAAPGPPQLLNRNSSSSSADEQAHLVGQQQVALEAGIVADDRLGDPPRLAHDGRASRRSEASRRSLRPFCRVPSTRPLAAQLEVDLGELEAVRRRLERAEAPPRPGA